MVYKINEVDRTAFLCGGKDEVIAPADGSELTCAIIFLHGHGDGGGVG